MQQKQKTRNGTNWRGAEEQWGAMEQKIAINKFITLKEKQSVKGQASKARTAKKILWQPQVHHTALPICVRNPSQKVPKSMKTSSQWVEYQ